MDKRIILEFSFIQMIEAAIAWNVDDMTEEYPDLDRRLELLEKLIKDYKREKAEFIKGL